MVLNLSDSEFLKYYTQAANMLYNNGEDEVVFIKDKESYFYYMSPAYIEALNYKEQKRGEFVLGIDMPEANNEMFGKAKEEDLRIQKTLASQSFLYVDITTCNRISLTQKRPIVNPYTNNFVGIIGSVRPFIMPNILDLIYRINNVSYGIANSKPSDPLKYRLTTRQHMVLFLYVNKYTYTQASSIMSTLHQKISPARINDHLESLKSIFNVKTKEQLIEKAVSLKYHLLIPRKFLNAGSYAIDDTMLISQL